MNKNLSIRPVDIIVAGAQKAATSSLHRYTGGHPQVITHTTLEFTYFVLEDEWKQGYEKCYRKHFDKIDNSKKVLAKSVGVMYYEHALKNLKDHNANAKIIILLRNPVDRAYSAYWYAYGKGHEPLKSFEEAIRADPNRATGFIAKGMIDYKGRGNYASQLEMVYRYFDKTSVLILLQDEMKSNITGLMKKVFDFCELDSSFVPDTNKKYNESSESVFPAVSQMLIKQKSLLKSTIKSLVPARLVTKAKSQLRKMNSNKFTPPPMNPETRKQLLEVFKPMNERLEKLTGFDLSSWNE